MLMYFSQVLLFFTAAMAGRVCAANGFRNLGIAAFLVLELSYLTMWLGSWWVAVVLMLIGTMIVFRCQRKVSEIRSF